ncbi:uncharacterized protein LOC121856254 [Homarus americanus]|uniref:Putative Alcohol dehydrogenase transcription factor Myb/SANT-like-containing protein 30 n=1 Tax=Homarus americanus TaxID=6706 RepID=A0A8J5MK36_HOMAM|nr:uncharacterized protein LOC121856254 [Homarus americanus]KAG7154418.1 putative Alcohol dehydrogenase transcription factor Myb/SANT-like-containing protein 30 [Homarus americanus]
MNHPILWCHEAIVSLLKHIRQEEVLWDTKHHLYYNETMKMSLLDQICKELRLEYPGMIGLSTDIVVKKFATLQKRFERELNKIKATSNGPNSRITTKWEYFKACSFLLPVYDNCTSEPCYQPTKNLTDEIMSDDTLEMDEPVPSPSSSLVSSQPSRPNSSLSITHVPPLHRIPKRIQKRKIQDSAEVMQQKIIESLDCVRDTWSSQPHQSQPFRFDAATEAAMSFMNLIPNSHQHLKDEFTEKVFFLVADMIKKYNSEKDSEQMTDNVEHFT